MQFRIVTLKATYLCARNVGIVATDTCMFPRGNRLFIRTVSYLYCIGDPRVAHDRNAKGRAVAYGQ